MSTLAELIVRIDTDISGVQRGFTAVQRAANQLGDRLTSLGRNLSVGVTAPVALLGASFVKAAADMDSLTRGLTAVSGSAAAASAEFANLKEVAKLPGLGLQEAVQGSINLQAAGFSAGTARRALLEFGNALATVGKGRDDLQGVITALSQMASKGKISAEELNQLAERVPQIRVVLKEAFGTVDTTAIQKAGIDVNEFVTRTLDALGKLPRVAGGIGNEFENLADSFFQLRAAIGNSLLPAIVPLVQGLAVLFDRARSLNPETLRTVIAFGAVAAAAGPVLIAIGSVTTAVTTLATALSIGLLPIIAVGGPIVIALGLVAAAFAKTGLDALAAAADANAAAAQFQGALATMSQAQLQARLGASTASISAMIRSRNALMARVQVGSRGEVPESQRGLLQTIQNLQGLIDAKAAELGAITTALNAREAVTSDRPLIPDNTTHKLTEAERAAQALAAKMRQIQIASADAAKAIDGFDFSKLDFTLPDKLPDEVFSRAKLAGHDAKRFSPGSGSIFGGPLEATSGGGQALAAASEAARKFGGVITSVAGSFARGVGQMLAAVDPVTLILQEVFPLVEALAVPFSVLGSILSTAVLPIFKLLFPILRAAAVAASYVAEVFDRVASLILRAVGALVKGLGTLIDKIPGLGDFGLKKAGQALIDTGKGLSQAADDIVKKRKELEDLTFAEALDRATHGANQLAEALINAASGFKIERFRFAAADAGRPGSEAPRTPGPRRADTGSSSVTAPALVVQGGIHITAADGESASDLWDRLLAEIQRRALSNPYQRATAALLT